MAKRSSKPKSASPSNALERQLEGFAEQLGYVAGSIESLASGVASRVRRKPPARPVRKARSGGAVDAPGKKHRKPAPAGPPAAMARTRNTRVSGAAPRARAAGHRPRQG